MAGFLYYIPGGRRGQDEKQLAAAGLAHALAGSGATQCEVTAGPDGTAGLVLVIDVANPAMQPPCKYEPDRQTWRKLGKLWLGWLKDARPGPFDLIRDRTYAGLAIRLRDGADWGIPIVRSWTATRPSSLPTVMDLDEAGQWIGKPEPEYSEVIAKAEKVWAAITGKPAADFTYADEADVAVAALAINYRISQAEVAALGLLDTSTTLAVLMAMVDGVEFVRRAKAHIAQSPATADVPAGEAPAATPQIG